MNTATVQLFPIKIEPYSLVSILWHISAIYHQLACPVLPRIREFAASDKTCPSIFLNSEIQSLLCSYERLLLLPPDYDAPAEDSKILLSSISTLISLTAVFALMSESPSPSLSFFRMMSR